MFDDVLDAATVEASHDMVIREKKAELLFLQVVANAVRAGEARLHNA